MCYLISYSHCHSYMEHCPDTVLFRTTTGGFRGWAVLVGPHDAEILHKKSFSPGTSRTSERTHSKLRESYSARFYAYTEKRKWTHRGFCRYIYTKDFGFVDYTYTSDQNLIY